ncbi:hypothetical protein [Lysinibacter sp. HNR]|uniref:hypothetical protein n=1 Tax=Lysinibacter sp. HNR TaxID=3031408 RepID=UPI002435C92D|nr:hypothetical protein [Lysinibacter sp. HNR]WGD38500.1 hypothetical protein FrondiHNR_06205 [Lysinibacter sp. HNR]
MIDLDRRAVKTTRAQSAAMGKDIASVRRRLRIQARRILDAVPSKADLFVLEAPTPKSQLGSHNDRVGLYWFLVDQLLVRGAVGAVLPPHRAMYATGNGAAKKPQVVAAMKERFPGVAIPDDNVADALVLASMGARWLGHPLDGVLSEKQKTAYDKASWPVLKG